MNDACIMVEEQNTQLEIMLQSLLHSIEFQAKKDIQMSAAGQAELTGYNSIYSKPGDDCAAFPAGEGYQLLAIEGMLPGFVKASPFQAGWSAVMANVSDIAAMGGRPVAIVNAYWHHDDEQAANMLQGIKKACEVYNIAFAGGHTCRAADVKPGLAVAILGYASSLLSCYHVEPGQAIYMVTDLNGKWYGDNAYWNCLSGKSHEQIRNNWNLLPELAEQGLVVSAKDISNAGVIGSLLMMLELNRLGASIDLQAIPKPENCQDLLRWLKAFHSYGFLMTGKAEDSVEISELFQRYDLCCAEIGTVIDRPELIVNDGDDSVSLWDFGRDSLTGYSNPTEQESLCPR